MDIYAIETEKNENLKINDRKADVCPRKKFPSFWQNLKYYTWEYCNRSTVHGLGYLGERSRTIPERIWWIISVIIALYLCISLITNTYQKWMTSPTIVTLATTQTSMWDIPFPAVTICPEAKSEKSIYNFTDACLKNKFKENVTEIKQLEYQYMLLVCQNALSEFDWNLTTINETSFDFLIKVAPKLNDTFLIRKWMGSKSAEFYPILTDDGLCYTFNGLDRSELFTDIVKHHGSFFFTNGKRSNWSLESGYHVDGDTNSYPERIFTPGFQGGLDLNLYVYKEDIDFLCGNVAQGFKVMLHNPEEVPFRVDKYFRVPLDQLVTVAVKPNMMTTSDDLKNYSPAERQCYYSKERRLKYFKVYNQANCINECLVDAILEKCGCVGFYMPRQNSTSICSAGKYWSCVVLGEAFDFKVELRSEMKGTRKPLNSTRNKCDCLPSCNSLNFDFELSQSQWNWKPYFEIAGSMADWNPDKDEDLSMSQLTIFFKDMQFINSERNELYGQTEFWANCGGLLGLFTGFSFISALEILYYLTLRFTCNLYKFGRHYWSGSDELLDRKKVSKANMDNLG